MTKPEWLPDWQDEGAYPKPEDLSLKLWAWQFLRRNPDYQEDQARWRKLVDGLENSNDLPEPEEDMRFWVFEPPAEPGEKFNEYRKRVPQWRRGESLLGALVEKYGIKPGGWLPDPGQNRPTLVGFQTTGLKFIDGGPARQGKDWRAAVYPKPFEIYVCFNLEWPIDIQLEKTKTYLNERKKMLKKKYNMESVDKRTRVVMFPLYLRLLDAEASGADVDTMTTVLPPRISATHARQNVRNGLKAAKKLRDRDYLFIPLSKPHQIGPPLK